MYAMEVFVGTGVGGKCPAMSLDRVNVDSSA